MSSRAVATAVIDDDPQVYERKNVHVIYDEIASHFSSTRYKPWPIVSDFISSLPTGWVGLDSGTGNGKYLPLPLDRPGDILTMGLDRSINLLQMARSAGGRTRDVIWADVLGRGWRPGVFDYAISIATIHHLATAERRKSAVKRLVECVHPGHGRVLIYVWAIEQDELSKRIIPIDGEAITETGKDVIIPWVFSDPAGNQEQDKGRKPRVYNRYYHMFAKGELRKLVHDAIAELGLEVGSSSSLMSNGHPKGSRGVEFEQDGWERSNYYVELRRWECPT